MTSKNESMNHTNENKMAEFTENARLVQINGGAPSSHIVFTMNDDKSECVEIEFVFNNLKMKKKYKNLNIPVSYSKGHPVPFVPTDLLVDLHAVIANTQEGKIDKVLMSRFDFEAYE